MALESMYVDCALVLLTEQTSLIWKNRYSSEVRGLRRRVHLAALKERASSEADARSVFSCRCLGLQQVGSPFHLAASCGGDKSAELCLAMLRHLRERNHADFDFFEILGKHDSVRRRLRIACCESIRTTRVGSCPC